VQGGDRVLREVWFGKVWRINPVRIVEETAELAVLHSPPGSIALYPVDEAGKEVRIPRPDGWTLGERVAAGHALVLVRPGTRYSLWLFWSRDGEFSHWYVNFERPLGPTRIPPGEPPGSPAPPPSSGGRRGNLPVPPHPSFVGWAPGEPPGSPAPPPLVRFADRTLRVRAYAACSSAGSGRTSTTAAFCLRGISRAVRAPTPTTAAPIQVAATRPSVNCAAEV
jgi:Protein of unknown function (DUF402)